VRVERLREKDRMDQKIKALAFKFPHPSPLPEGEVAKWDSGETILFIESVE
jgi:hypothetical protein